MKGSYGLVRPNIRNKKTILKGNLHSQSLIQPMFLQKGYESLLVSYFPASGLTNRIIKYEPNRIFFLFSFWFLLFLCICHSYSRGVQHIFYLSLTIRWRIKK